MTTRTHRHPPLLALAAGSALALGSATPNAHAVILLWANAAGGNATIGTNWSPNQVPTAADVLNFNLNASYNVNFFDPVIAASQINLNAGTVGITFSNGMALSGQFVVGLNAGANVITNLGGNATVGGTFVVGGGAGGTAVLNIPGPSQIDATSNFGIRIGNSGNGTLNLTGRGVLRATVGPITFGALANSQGSALISGSNGATFSRFQATHPTAGDINVGLLGPGSLTVAAGAFVAAADDFIIASNAGVSGLVSIGSATPNTSTIAAADLFVASNSTASAAGSGTLNINPGAAVTVTNSTTLGDPDGGTGTLNLAGGLLATPTLLIQPGTGDFNHTGGELRITAGGFFNTTAGPLLIEGPDPANPAHLHYQGSTGMLVSGFRVGNAGAGALTIDAGALVDATNGPGFSMSLGSAGPGEGTLTISGAGSTLRNISSNAVIIGGNGRGTAHVTNGGRLVAGSVNLAFGPNGQGTLNASTGGHITAITVQVGLATGGGVGAINLSSSAQFDAQNLTLFPGCSLTLDDAVLTLNTASVNTADLRGSTTMSSAAELAADVVLLSGTLQGSGNVYGDLTIQPTGIVNAAGGDLFLGSISNGNSGFINQGTLNVGAASVHILDGNGSPGGDITLAGGHLFGPRLTLGGIDSLRGFGGISAPMTFNGATIEATTPEGIVFNAPVTASSPCIWFGTKFTFAAGCTLQASGGIPTIVASEEETTINAVSSFVMGDNNVDNAILLEGPLHIGGAEVTLRSDTNAQLGVLTTIAGGTLNGPADNSRIVNVNPFPLPPQHFTVFDAVPLALSGGDILQGFGTVTTKLATAPGSQVIAQGALTLRGSGIAPLFSTTPQGDQTIDWRGDLAIGTQLVTFTDSHDFQSTSTVTIAGGTLAGTTIRSRGVLSGHGAVQASLSNGGTLRPGGTGFGQLSVIGNLTNSMGVISPIPGTIDIQISGDEGLPSDAVVATQDASLRGTLNITLVESEPPAGHVYSVIRCQGGSILGTFDTVNLPSLASGASLEVRYTPSEVQIVVRPACRADFNTDGNLDPDDLSDYIACFFSQPPCPQGDFNSDGNIDPDDLSDYIGAFFSGCP